MDRFEQFAAEQLGHMGFEVSKLNTSDSHRMPDFLVKSAGESYLIEVKSKNDGPDEKSLQREKFASNSIHVTTAEIKRHNRISGIISDACDQLVSHPEHNSHFRLIWLQSAGLDESLQFDQFIASAYGIVELNSFDPSGLTAPNMKECYFFSQSDFYRHRVNLDGIIVGKSNSGRLCLNPYSPKFEALKSSSIAEAMHPAVIDPFDLEASSKAYIADSSVDRRNEQEVLKSVQRKYAIKYLSIAQSVHVGQFAALSLGSLKNGT